MSTVHVHPQTVAIAKDERFASLLLSLVLRTVRAPSFAAAVVDSESCSATSSLVPRLRPYPEIILWTGNEMFRICQGRVEEDKKVSTVWGTLCNPQTVAQCLNFIASNYFKTLGYVGNIDVGLVSG